jgi:hypothetical protein
VVRLYWGWGILVIGSEEIPVIRPTHLADAEEKIVFDRYHIMKYVTGAVDTVRKQESLRHFWSYRRRGLAEKHWKRW